jgi:sirohydrochlorin cobaltochelatase
MQIRFRVQMVVVGLIAAFLTVAAGGVSAGHGDARAEKDGILLVAFGTTVPEAEKAIENIDAEVRKAFPETEIRWAYTSNIVRHKLAKEVGKQIDSPARALARMMDDGFTRVAVQSLHTIPGEEYHGLVRTARSFAGMPKGMNQVLVGRPLLSTTADMERVVDAVLANVPAERRKDEAVVLMGHGTHHPGNVYYPGIQYFFAEKDPNVFVGTVEGTPSLDDVATELKARDIKKAYLMPLMSVAGDHARNDMAGPEEDSWKSVLTRQGITCVPVLRGTAEYDNIVAVWVDHLRAVMARLNG